MQGKGGGCVTAAVDKTKGRKKNATGRDGKTGNGLSQWKRCGVSEESAVTLSKGGFGP